MLNLPICPPHQRECKDCLSELNNYPFSAPRKSRCSKYNAEQEAIWTFLGRIWHFKCELQCFLGEICVHFLLSFFASIFAVFVLPRDRYPPVIRRKESRIQLRSGRAVRNHAMIFEWMMSRAEDVAWGDRLDIFSLMCVCLTCILHVEVSCNRGIVKGLLQTSKGLNLHSPLSLATYIWIFSTCLVTDFP